MKRGIHRQEVFLFIVMILALAAVATVPGSPLAEFVDPAIGLLLFIISFVIGAAGLFSLGIVGFLAFGVFGWLALVAVLLLLFKMEFNVNFVLAAIGLFALMLVVV